MNTTNPNKGGWPSSEMRKYLNVIENEEGSGTIFKALPEELQKVIIPTKVISGHRNITEANFESIDKIYLLSLHEAYEEGILNKLSQYDTAWDNTRQLDYYKNYKEQGVTTDDYEGAIKKYNDVAIDWWLRTGSGDYFFHANYDGSLSSHVAYYTLGVVPAFRIG